MSSDEVDGSAREAVRLRPAEVRDAEAVLQIYNREVLGSVVTLDLVPRSLEEQRSYIAERSGAHLVLVAEIGSGEKAKIIGFASLSPYRDRPGYRTSVENSVYVHRDHQRLGIGNLLLGSIVEQAQAHGFHALFARIAGAQQASMSLHERHSFFLVGTEREAGRKFGRWLDVALMQRLL